MNRGLAIALCLAALALGTGTARAQVGAPSQCMKFPAMSQATQEKANAVSAAMKAKADRKEICRLMTAFVASEDIGGQIPDRKQDVVRRARSGGRRREDQS